MGKIAARNASFSLAEKNELLRGTHHTTPLSGMQTFTGLIKAYWVSDQWKQAWGYTLGLGAFIAAASQSNVWMAQYAGEMMDTLSKLPSMTSGSPLKDLLGVGGAILGVSALQHLALYPGKKFLLENLHRKWRGWLNTQFNDAILDDKHTYLHLTHGIKEEKPGAPVMPGNIDQRWQDSVKGMTGSALGLAHGAVSVATSALFVTMALLKTTQEVKGLEVFGEYGTLALTFGAAAAYVPINTFVAWKIGRYLERLNNRIDETEASYRSELNTMMRLGLHIASSGAAKIQSKINGKLYDDVDHAWKKLITAHTGYSAFNGLYSALSNRIVAYAPGLPAYLQGATDFRGYITGSELFTSFINDCSWLINVMPAISGLKAQYKRVSEVVHAVERVQDSQDFFRKSGHSNYTFDTQDQKFGMRVRNMSLMHQGQDAEPFLRADNLRFRPGQWTLIQGPSGCGKSSMLRAINGLLPYGEANIIMPKGSKSFYACQEVRLNKTNLKQLVCIPDDEDAHTDRAVTRVLRISGLGQFAEHLDQDGYEGKRWEDILSGGQKQNLVLARILLQKPGVLFLDEATSALDPVAKINFHEAIKAACPDTIVLSVMHDPAPPLGRNGQELYDTIIEISNGVAHTKSSFAASLKKLKPDSQHSFAPTL